MNRNRFFALINLVGFGGHFFPGCLRGDTYLVSVALVYLIVAKWFWEAENGTGSRS